eukprot:4481905-Pyramimonas_sp.AAC.1
MIRRRKRRGGTYDGGGFTYSELRQAWRTKHALHAKRADGAPVAPESPQAPEPSAPSRSLACLDR